MKSWLLVIMSLIVISHGYALEGYAVPQADVSLDDSLIVFDSAVFSSGYVSDDGVSWDEFSFTGRTRGNWIIGEASSSVRTDANYYAIYSCSWNSGWSCSNNWQVYDQSTDEPEENSSEYISKDSVQGDFEALQALYESTQGQYLPTLSDASQLPQPRDATYPFMYLVDGEIYYVTKERSYETGSWVNAGVPWTDRTGWADMTPETMGEAVGVEVNEDGRVIVLDMEKVNLQPLKGGYIPQGNNLAGVLPPEIGNLRQLTQLNVKRNFFHDTIPSEIGYLENLERLSLGGQHWELRLDDRRMWAEANHVQISYDNDPYTWSVDGKVIASTNRFRSDLPPEIGNLQHLELIEIRHQPLTGTLPEEWGNLPSIKGIFLDNVRGTESDTLGGTIPESWGNLDTIVFFKLGNYDTTPRFSGTLPEGMHSWSNLSNLAIPSNRFSGEFPAFTNLHDLVYFNIGSNDFTGEFPWESFFNGKNSRLNKLTIVRNSFSGELPETIPKPTHPIERDSYRLADFSILDNQFSGELHEWTTMYPGLQIYSVSDNKFTGEIPETLFGRSKLKVVRLHSNQLSGPLPDREWASYRMNWFHINNNNFTGTIPESWVTLFQDQNGEWRDTARRFYFGSNRLEGRIPDWAKNIDMDQYHFSNNLHVFADIIPVYDELKEKFGEYFTVSPQKPFGTAQTLSVNAGDELEIDLSSYVSHPNNVYEWLLNDELVQSTINPVLRISSVDSNDEGEYVLRVTNSFVEELTLYSEPIRVNIS